ncbi:hypothetical protein HKBW3S34_00614 [Candidatus Hakubella thermalkaliphila]|uniref:Uncharacterized protein n=1 Tax=Candidatus Hakubella thermalkaliphila TaxID=2754717 RepID=A0A6V8PDH5_9ACTN|nr:hypothetical protein HKBW3S34_00614 [Candidatus Hakubella thermalkaliphila]
MGGALLERSWHVCRISQGLGLLIKRQVCFKLGRKKVGPQTNSFCRSM